MAYIVDLESNDYNSCAFDNADIIVFAAEPNGVVYNDLCGYGFEQTNKFLDLCANYTPKLMYQPWVSWDQQFYINNEDYGIKTILLLRHMCNFGTMTTSDVRNLYNAIHHLDTIAGQNTSSAGTSLSTILLGTHVDITCADILDAVFAGDDILLYAF